MYRRNFIQCSGSLFAGALLAGVGAPGVASAAATTAAGPSSAPLSRQNLPSRAAPRVSLGIDVLAANGFDLLRGARVGLLTHAAGLDSRGRKTVDVLRFSRSVRLVKLFGPEHGIYGDLPANAVVKDAVDRRTGLPVFSLYGATRRPTPAMLAGLDALVVDLQDIGARTYTYVSCMRYAIEACFEAGVRVVVLDRPNPLGGLKTDGPGLDEKWMSYVGAFRVPYVHGLTIGELALAAIRTPGWLKLSPAAARNGRLDVVKMRGWTRRMRWRDTGLLWRPTSPGIPNVEAAEGYPLTGLGCQAGDFSHGSKQGGVHAYFFRFIHYPKKRGVELERALRSRRIPGVGVSPWRLRDGTEGVYLSIPDWNALRPTETSFHMMQLACQWAAASGAKNPFVALTKGEQETAIKHIGSEAFFNELCRKGASVDVSAWVARWQREALAFQTWSRKHWLYPA